MKDDRVYLIHIVEYKEYIVETGYDPDFGASSLTKAVQKN